MDASEAVSGVMTPIVFRAHPDDSLLETARRMREFRVSGLPVVDGEDRLVGLISEVDLVRDLDRSTGLLQPRGLLDLLLEARGKGRESPLESAQRRLARGRVKDAMAVKVVAIDPDDSIAEAARLMQLHGISRLPVTDAGRRVVGIVSHADVIGAISGVRHAPRGRRVPSLRTGGRKAMAARSPPDPFGDI